MTETKALASYIIKYNSCEFVSEAPKIRPWPKVRAFDNFYAASTGVRCRKSGCLAGAEKLFGAFGPGFRQYGANI